MVSGIKGGWEWSRGMERQKENEARIARTTVVKVKLHVGGLVSDETAVEGWVFPHERWNGFMMPMMTAKQLDAFIKVQDPELLETNESDLIFLNEDNVYCIRTQHGVTKLTKMRCHTPDGETLYSMSNDWCWELIEDSKDD